MHSSHFHFIPTSIVIYEWCWNDGMRWDEGRFLNQGKTLNSETSLIRLHSVILSEYPSLHTIIPFIWGSVRHSNLIPVQGQFQNHPMLTLYSFLASKPVKRVLSLYKRQHPFISFWPHSASFSVHSKIPNNRSCLEWDWNDRMIQEWEEWGRNEINGCCLFIRDSTRLFHSDLILHHSQVIPNN